MLLKKSYKKNRTKKNRKLKKKPYVPYVRWRPWDKVKTTKEYLSAKLSRPHRLQWSRVKYFERFFKNKKNSDKKNIMPFSKRKKIIFL